MPVLTPRVDIANVRLRFDSGCIANLTASRISRERVRKVRFFQRQSYLSIDYASQEVEWYRLQTATGAPSIEGGKLDVPREEPLKLELADFVDAVRSKRRAARHGRRRPPGAGAGAPHHRGIEAGSIWMSPIAERADGAPSAERRREPRRDTCPQH